MRFIGDIHGDVLKYSAIIHDAEESVQVGDFGIGFLRDYQIVDLLHKDGRHRFIRGNHDDPELCQERVGYIEDGTYDDERGIMYTGGAWSIDWAWRIQKMDMGHPPIWWADEELSTDELHEQHDIYTKARPEIMVTHDCPESVAIELFIGHSKTHHKTRTQQCYESMFYDHQPDIWIFGHWHEDRDVTINGTRFICLGINSYIDLEV